MEGVVIIYLFSRSAIFLGLNVMFFEKCQDIVGQVKLTKKRIALTEMKACKVSSQMRRYIAVSLPADAWAIVLQNISFEFYGILAELSTISRDVRLAVLHNFQQVALRWGFKEARRSKRGMPYPIRMQKFCVQWAKRSMFKRFFYFEAEVSSVIAARGRVRMLMEFARMLALVPVEDETRVSLQNERERLNKYARAIQDWKVMHHEMEKVWEEVKLFTTQKNAMIAQYGR